MSRPQLDPITKRWCDRRFWEPPETLSTSALFSLEELIGRHPHRAVSLYCPSWAQGGMIRRGGPFARTYHELARGVFGVGRLQDWSATVHVQDGLIHREDGPAIEFDSGMGLYFERGLRWARAEGAETTYFLPGTAESHRFGGPAIQDANGNRAWFVGGRQIGEHWTWTDHSVISTAGWRWVRRALRRGDLSALRKEWDWANEIFGRDLESCPEIVAAYHALMDERGR